MGVDFSRVRTNVLNALRLRDELEAYTKVYVIQIDVPNIDGALLEASRAAWRDAGAEVLRYGYLDRAGNVRADVAGRIQRDPSLVPRGCELHRHRERMYVLTDGTVIFCCHDWRVRQPVGSLVTSNLADIWLSEAYRQLREQVEGARPSSNDFLCRHCKICPTEEAL